MRSQDFIERAAEFVRLRAQRRIAVLFMVTHTQRAPLSLQPNTRSPSAVSLQNGIVGIQPGQNLLSRL